MHASNDLEESFIIAYRAIKYLSDWQCPASPRNYELAYGYSSGADRALADEIAASIAATGTLLSADAERLWSKYCSGSVDDISDRLNGEIGQVLDMLHVAAGRSTEYSKSLGSASEELEASVDADTLNIIVESLVETTKAMGVQSQQMQGRLRESTEQIAALKKNLDEAHNESLTDRITGIANRKHFDERIAAETAASELNGEDLCLLIGDIDFFKKFNDSYGHQTGDQVLNLVGQALKAGLKGRDLAARYGGEEFAIILPGTGLTAAVSVGNTIRNSIRRKELVRKSTGESLGNITMSFGVAKYRRGESPDSLIGRADACLYAAKREGRNMVLSEIDPGVSTSAAVA